MQPDDEPRAYELIEEAFVRPGRAHVTYEEWRRFVVERDDFDRSLAFLAVIGDEIAGAAMCLMYPETQEGWVRQLAVDARYRGRGLGQALLLHAFGEFHRRGAPPRRPWRRCEQPVGYEAVPRRRDALAPGVRAIRATRGCIGSQPRRASVVASPSTFRISSETCSGSGRGTCECITANVRSRSRASRGLPPWRTHSAIR